MSTVFFISSRADSRERNLGKYQRLLAKLNLGRVVSEGDLVAIKLSFGERGNFAFLRPQYVRVVVDEVRRLGGRPFLTDGNTLYAGGRQNSRDHVITALENGFSYSATGAPVIMADGLLGLDYRPVPVKGKHFSEVKIGTAALDADAIIALTHFKGHMIFGFGGTLKNLGMGFGARAGKQMMHSDIHPEVTAERCNGCRVCLKWCPEDAIGMVPNPQGGRSKVALINDERCTGCGECVASCLVGAIDIIWRSDPGIVQEKTAEYVAGVLAGRKRKFAALNYIMDVSPDCDCLGWSDTAIVPDIGIAASTDPVALDAASLDLVNAAGGIAGSALPESCLQSGDKFSCIHTSVDPRVQLAHAERMKVGSRKYRLQNLDRPPAKSKKKG